MKHTDPNNDNGAVWNAISDLYISETPGLLQVGDYEVWVNPTLVKATAGIYPLKPQTAMAMYDTHRRICTISVRGSIVWNGSHLKAFMMGLHAFMKKRKVKKREKPPQSKADRRRPTPAV